MSVEKKFKLFVKQHNVRQHIRYEEVTHFFEDGYACVAKGQYLAACLCFVAGIEMSLRLPLLLRKGYDISRASDHYGTSVPLLKNQLLLQAKKNAGLPVELLRYSSETDKQSFLAQLRRSAPRDQVRIVNLRNNVCHGNLNIFVTKHEGEKRIYHSEIEKEARELENICVKWVEAYGEWLTKQEA